MSQIEKLKKKLREKPARSDMTYEEVEKLARSYGCTIKSGGKHPTIVVDRESGRIIAIPGHGKCVKEIYVVLLRELFDEIEARAN